MIAIHEFLLCEPLFDPLLSWAAVVDGSSPEIILKLADCKRRIVE